MSIFFFKNRLGKTTWVICIFIFYNYISLSELTAVNMEEQISQAKELLQTSDLEKKEEAVRILIDISKQGNQEATTILAKCMAGREGVTPENENEVKWCIKTSEEEKRLQHAVEEIYNSMKKDGEDKVALQDINEALKKAEAKLKVRLKKLC